MHVPHLRTLDAWVMALDLKFLGFRILNIIIFLIINIINKIINKFERKKLLLLLILKTYYYLYYNFL
jgi:hypothetical protein